MSQIGYYRYKLDNLTAGTHTVSFYKNGSLSVTHTAVIKQWCSEKKLIKYLDKNGQFRFFPFNRYYETKDKPKSIGKLNKVITSIYTDKTNLKNIGVKNDRTMSLVADDVSESELLILSDLWLSPQVYLYNGVLGSDEENDWIEVTITGGDTISKRRKLISGKVSIEVMLPEWFAITRL